MKIALAIAAVLLIGYLVVLVPVHDCIDRGGVPIQTNDGTTCLASTTVISR